MNHSEHIKMEDIMSVERPYNQRPIFKISWKMLNNCPYRCSYCYMANAVEKARVEKEMPTQQFVENIASHFSVMLDKLADEKDEVQLHLIGGEPSLYDLRSVLEKFDDKRFKYLNIASNLFRPFDYWDSLFDYCVGKGITVGVSASFHLEALNTKEKREEYAEKVLRLKQVQCKAVVNNDNLQEYYPYFKRFMDAEKSIEITLERDNKNKCCELSAENQRIVDEIRNYQYERKEAHLSYLPYYTVTLKNGRKIGYSSNIALINSIEGGIFDPSGFYCTAGQHNIRVESNGNLKRSACRLCSMYFKMGNILKDDYEKVTDEIICKCKEKGKDGILQEKYCTAFNNTSMYRLGYNRINGIYNENHGIEIPNYYEQTYE